jgi:hypothetical protein
MKRTLAVVLIGLFGFSMLFAQAKKVELEIRASQPEYLSQEQQIWNIYLEKNPHVTIKMIAVNESTSVAYQTRIAAGNPPDIDCWTTVNKTNYTNYINLTEIGFPNWGRYQYDAKNAWGELNGIPGYVPVLASFAGPSFSFIYHKDEMDKTGLNPRATVRTMADLDKFLAALKVYTEKNNIPYVLDTAWHPWVWGTMAPPMWSAATGGSAQAEKDLWNGVIKFTDMERNPYVPMYKLLKEYYDKGYFPSKWWTRSWEPEMENGFINKKSILIWHGPWLWTKVAAATPGAKLEGFPLPANKDGIIRNAGVEINKGDVLFTANKNKANYAEAVKAFIWWTSPEIIKLRAEALQQIPVYDLKDIGLPNLKGGQYVTVIKPVNEGFFGKAKYENSVLPSTMVDKFRQKTSPKVMDDALMSGQIGDFMEGKLTLADLMKLYQRRYDEGYTIPKL